MLPNSIVCVSVSGIMFLLSPLKEHSALRAYCSSRLGNSCEYREPCSQEILWTQGKTAENVYRLMN